MKYEFKPSFKRSAKSISEGMKEDAKSACLSFIDDISGILPLPKGYGLKNISGEFWEIRKMLNLRILFRWQRDLIQFIIAGTYEDIRRFLRSAN